MTEITVKNISELLEIEGNGVSLFFDSTDRINPVILDRVMRKVSNIRVSDNNPYYTSVDGVLLSKDGKRVIKCPAKRKGAFKIPDGVEVIEENAFAFSDIESVSFPLSMRRICSRAFDNCYELNSIDFGTGIEEIGSVDNDYIFNSCDKLEVLRFPKQVRSIGKGAFINSGVRAIAFNENLEKIGVKAFYASHLEKVSLPASIKELGKLSFSTIEKIIVNSEQLPKGFINAVTLDDFSSCDGVEAVSVYLKAIDKTIYIPKQLSKIGAETALIHLENCDLSEAETELFDKAYQFANVSDSAYLAALDECHASGNQETKEFLKKGAERILEKMLEANDESGLERLSGVGVLNKEQLERVGEFAEKNKYSGLSAYVMTQLSQMDEEDLFDI